jgi:hypothetical protein
MTLLARVLKGIGRTDEAEALCRSAIAISEAALGGPSIDAAT